MSNKNKTIENSKKIKIINKKVNEDIKTTARKLKICNFLNQWFSILVILINLTIIGFAFWALIKISIEITEHSKIKLTDIAIPIIVAIFTILLFVFSILLIVYSVKNKSFFYKESKDTYQYLLLQVKNGSYTNEELIKILDSFNSREIEIKKINYRKLIKKALGGNNAKK